MAESSLRQKWRWLSLRLGGSRIVLFFLYIAMEIISKKKVGEVYFEELKPTDLVWNTKWEIMQVKTAKALLETYRDDNKDVYRYTVKKRVTYESTWIEVTFEWLLHEKKIFSKEDLK